MAMNANFQAVGQQFAQGFYQAFDSNRQSLQPMYGDQSLLTFEGEQFMGAANIVQKLVSLPFQSVQHSIVKADYQPIPGTQNVAVFITGNLIVNGNSANPLKFSETFVLVQTPTGSYQVGNDVFRLAGN
eukprot:TRINITY_DN97783_c0_g1_i1.p1 TRINITY_DN97783_c0_g1~~TRINITY_DN97783_c0_g1_i1.p1  ORF type:complete len:129 (-),score=6.90 TRINITY_DN97783_c0_g1_i1:126-512(-)